MNGFQAVTLADIDEAAGKVALEDLTLEFGENRTLFVKADVTNQEQFEGFTTNKKPHFTFATIIFFRNF